MRNRTLIIDLDKGTSTVLRYKQYDNNNLLKVIIKEREEDVILTGYTAKAFFLFPSTLILESNCTINEDNTIDVTLNNNILAESGKVFIEIMLTSADQIVTTFRCYFTVEASIDRDSAVSSEEFALIRTLSILDNVATIDNIPTNISALENDAGFLTEVPDDTLEESKIINGVLHLTKDKYQKVTVNETIKIALPKVSEFTQINLFLDMNKDVDVLFPSCLWNEIPMLEEGKCYKITFIYINKWLAELTSYIYK